MKPRHILQVILVILVAGCSQYRQPKNILRQTADKIQQIKNLEYSARIITKDFESVDTSYQNISLLASRKASDRILGYKIRLNTGGEEYIYNPPHLFQVDHARKNILKINTANDVHAISDLPVKTSLFHELMYDDFYRQILDPAYQVRKIRSDQDYWVIRVNYPPEEEIREMQRTLWISKNHHLPEKMEYRVTYKEQTYYQRIEVGNLSTTPELKPGTFSADNAIDQYPLKRFVSDYLPYNEALSAGSKAPEFEHISLSGDTISLADHEGELVLLYFWYIDCSACQSAIPAINALHEKFGRDEFVVMGLNCMDQDKSELAAYREDHLIAWPFLLGDEYTESRYRIEVYPSLFLIDRRGVIQHTTFGMSEASMSRLQKKTEQLLSRR